MLDARTHPRVFDADLQCGDFGARAHAAGARYRCGMRAVEDVERAEEPGGTGRAGGGEDEGFGVRIDTESGRL